MKELSWGFLLLALGCATYYTRSIKFQEHFVRGELEQAAKVLDKSKRAAKDRNRLLYFLQKGVVLQMLGKHEESNRFFEEAYLFTEDIQKNYAAEAFGLLSNPTVTPYKGEDFELVQMHYYKALNDLKLGQFEEALVECRRINIKLNRLNDKYSKRKNRYKTDAFALNLMGMIFEASGDHNNAFISYRNAYEAYEEEYKPSFGVETPLQLKKDLLRSAYLNGFTEELDRYEKLFGLKYVAPVGEGGHLVFFWHNGLGPVKDEWSINFFIVRGQGGLVTFVNEELGLSFPFLLDGGSGKTSTELGDLRFIRAAFPKYLERKPYFRSAQVGVSDKTYPLEVAQNINEIALKTLEDRMVRELSHSLLRLAVKQASEQAVRKKNENLGALLSVVTALSEKADTRNWQTLPYSISYARLPLPAGERCSVELRSYSPRKSRASSVAFQVEGEPGETLFWVHHTLESLPLDP